MYNNSIYLTKEQILDNLKCFYNRMIMSYNIDHASPYFINIEDGASFVTKYKKTKPLLLLKNHTSLTKTVITQKIHLEKNGQLR